MQRNLHAVPDAAKMIADYVDDYAQERVRLDPPGQFVG